MAEYVLENRAGVLSLREVSEEEGRATLEPWKVGFVRMRDGSRLVLRAEYDVPGALEAA